MIGRGPFGVLGISVCAAERSRGILQTRKKKVWGNLFFHHADVCPPILEGAKRRQKFERTAIKMNSLAAIVGKVRDQNVAAQAAKKAKRDTEERKVAEKKALEDQARREVEIEALVDAAFEELEPKVPEDNEDTEEDDQEEVGKKRKASKLRIPVADEGVPLAPAMPFGPNVRIQIGNIFVPFHSAPPTQEHVISTLKKDSLLTLILHTAFYRCTDTTTGKVLLHPATLCNSTGTYPVFVGHYSVLQRVLIQLFAGFTRNRVNHVNKEQIASTLEPLTARGLSRADMDGFRALTGTAAMPLARQLTEGHFVISANFVCAAANALRCFHFIEEVLQPDAKTNKEDIFCTDRRVNIEWLKIYSRPDGKDLEISAHKMCHTVQSKVTEWVWMPRKDPAYTELTHQFGLPLSDAQLASWAHVRRMLNNLPETPAVSHQANLFDVSKAPVKTRAEILAAHPDGIANDAHLRPELPHNMAHLQCKKVVKSLLVRNNIAPPTAGRPSKHSKVQGVVKELMQMVRTDKGYVATAAPPAASSYAEVIAPIIGAAADPKEALQYSAQDLAAVQRLLGEY